jgi:phasin family protein
LTFIVQRTIPEFEPAAAGLDRCETQPEFGCKGMRMLKNFDDLQKLGKDNIDVALKQASVVAKGVQAIAGEVADYAKKSFEDTTMATEKMFGAKTLEKAIEVQTDYAKVSYEGFVARATKIGELYADLAKEAFKPLEGYVGKVAPTK